MFQPLFCANCANLNKENIMRVSYKKLALLEAVEMSQNTLAKLGGNETVLMDVLKRICAHVQCDVGDIIEMIPKDE